jgi:hypothetical protein
MLQEYSATISGLLRRRQEQLDERFMLQERIAVLTNDLDAIDRILDSMGYAGDLAQRTPRADRMVLFYRNELRRYLLDTLRGIGEPVTSRSLAQGIVSKEGKDLDDRRFMNEVVARVSRALVVMRDQKLVVSQRDAEKKTLWRSM